MNYILSYYKIIILDNFYYKILLIIQTMPFQNHQTQYNHPTPDYKGINKQTHKNLQNEAHYIRSSEKTQNFHSTLPSQLPNHRCTI